MQIGTDLVYDQAEEALLNEVQVAKNCQNKLRDLSSKCINQVCTQQLMSIE